MNKISTRAAALFAAAFFSIALSSMSQADPRVVYGVDDRKDIYQVTNADQLAASQSVAALIDVTRLTNNGNGTFTIGTTISADVCPGQPFQNQPMAAFGTCFMVDDNTVATAGAFLEFVDSGATPLNSFRVVFGFEQTALNTTTLIIPAADIFTPTGINYNADYGVATLTVDRSMTTPQRKPLAVRRSGRIADNARVGIISYPAGSLAEDFSGLPEKIAFGNRTRVYDNSANDVFTANTDSFNHSDGSPVINQDTMLVEGILFNGDRDFYEDGGCLKINTVPDSAAFEQVLRTEFIKSDLPAIVDVYFTKRALRCGGVAEVHVYNEAAVGNTLSASITTQDTLDSEPITLTREPGTSDFRGTINVQQAAGPASPNTGTVEVTATDIVTVSHVYALVTYQDQASVDCTSPTVNVASSSATYDTVTLNLSASEPGTFTITGGTTCGSQLLSNTDGVDTAGTVSLRGLQPCTTYYFTANFSDPAGNSVTNNNGGNCFAVTTLAETERYREDFFVALGWTNVTQGGTNNWGVRADNLATSAPTVYSYQPGGDLASSSYLLSPILPAGDLLEFSHTFNFQSRADGGIIEISTDNGQSWSDLGPFIREGGYTRRLTKGASESNPNPYVGRLAYNGGTLSTMTRVRADISSFTGTQNRVRFVFATNNSNSIEDPTNGWLIDDVTVVNVAPCTKTGWTLQ